MAELRNAEAAVEALETALETLQRFYEDTRQDDRVLEPVRVAITSLTTAFHGDVAVTMAKFRDRMKMVDPITNEPRFGPKTMARVRDMLTRYDAIYDEAVERAMLVTMQQRIDAYDAAKAAKADAHRRQEAEAQEAALRQQAIERQREETERRAQQERERVAEEQRIAELARLAQRKREERECQRLADEARAKEEQARLARSNASVEVGVAGLTKAVGQLCDGLRHDAALMRATLHKLDELLANVCASPENTVFRYIPKDNAHFHRDIGQYDGGYNCLLAVGFQEREPEPGKRVFIMEEPDLSDDFDKWSQWFDGLKEMKTWLETQMK